MSTFLPDYGLGSPGRRSDVAGGRRGRSRLGRLIAVALVLALGVTGFGAASAPPAEAAINVPFEPRFSANTNGDIIIRGNQLLNCPTSAATCATARTGTGTATLDQLNNNNYNMGFVDVDSDASTRSSSSSTITIPTTSTVLFAGLYWSGYTTAGTGGAAPPSGTAQNRLLLNAPGTTGYRTITASTVMNASGTGGVGSYQSFADVTSIVAGSRTGVYTAADIHAGTGADRYGAWSIVVVYGDPNLPSRNLTVFDGYGVIRNATGDTTASIPVSGFVTPSSAPFTTRMGAVVYEGDAGFTGDQFTITRPNGTTLNLTNALNPSDNAFNSTQSDNGTAITGRNPQQANMFGYDADVFQGQLLNPGDRSATLGFTTGGETYFPGVLTFATDIFAPTLSTTKAQALVDVNGDGQAGIGDRIRYTIDVTNTGRDASINSVLADPLPQGTTLFPGSLTIDGVAVTAAADGDRAEVVEGALSARLGTTPGTTGGRMDVGATTRIVFEVVIGSSLADNTDIVNRAALRYNGLQTGQALSSTSNPVSTIFTAPRSDLLVAKSADSTIVQRDGSRSLTYTIRVRNAGPDPDSAVQLVDTLPTGFTATSVTGTGCGTVSGGTLTCNLGALAVGATAVVTVAGTVAANAPASLTNSATATGASIDPTPGVPGTVTTAVNTPPTAANDTATVAGGAGSTVTFPVLGNDADADGDPLTVSSAVIVPPAHGTVSVNPSGTLTYTVTDPAFKGTDTITYRISDGRGGTATAEVAVTVQNQAPVALDDSDTTPPDTARNVAVLANDRDANGDPLTVTILTQPTGGSAAVQPDGSITVTPDAGFAGDLVVEYQVCDDNTPTPGCATAELTVTVANAPPRAFDDRFETPFGTALTITPAQVLSNDTDANDDDLTVVDVQVGDVIGGTVSWTAGSDIVFTPAPGFTGEARFTYTISDGTTETSATIFVDVPNNAPTAADDDEVVTGSTELTIPIGSLIDDPETPDQLTVALLTQPTNGSVRIVDGAVVFQADPGFKGPQSFQYQVCDPQGLCATGTVNIDVANQPPVAADNSRSVRPSQTIQVPVLLNDTDPNGDPLTLTRIVSGPGAGLGSATANPATGLITYTPAPGQTAPASIVYETCDDNTPTAGCDTATLTVTIVNTLPDARNDAGSAFHTAGQPTTVPLQVLANDSDPDGEPLTISGISQPVVGSAELVTDPDAPGGFRIDYTAPAGFIGTVVFSYIASDPSGGSSQALVTVTIENRAPVTTDETGTAAGGDPTSFDVLDNDTDADGDPLEVRLDGAPSAGTAEVVDNEIVYTPPLAAGTYTVPYLACDPYGSCTPGELTVTVANVGPVAVDDEVTTPFETPIDIPVAQLLVNDTDANGDTLTVVSVQDAVDGTVELVDGVVTFTPADGFVGTASFTYTISDPDGLESTATVSVVVPNTAPVANDDQAGTPTNTPVDVPILANDLNGTTGRADVETPNADLEISIVSGPTAEQGTAEITGTGADRQLLFTPADGFSGTVEITYEICDDAPGNLQLCDTAVVTIVVDDAAPVAVDDYFTTPFETDLDLTDDDLLGNDTDLNGDDLVVVSVQDAVNGTVDRADDGTIVFTPAAGFTGQASFTYTIEDPDGAQSTATVFVLVPNTPPTAVDDTATVAQGGTTTIDVLENDSDAETPNADLEIDVLGVSTGTAEVVDGQIVYTAPAGFFGTATIVYEITDGAGLTDTAIVTITVDGLPDAVDDELETPFETPFETPLTLSDALLLSNDTDPDTDREDLAVVAVFQGTGGSVVRNPTTGEIVFTPADGFYGTATFTYTMTDGTSTSTATVTIEVPNTRPVANDDQAGTLTNTPVEIPILANDLNGTTGRADVETPDADLAIEIVSGPTAEQGTAEITGTGADRQLLFTPADGFSGTVEITYEICDDAPGDLQLCDTAVVTIVVDDAAPVAVDDYFTTPFETDRELTDEDLLGNDLDLNGDDLVIVSVQDAVNGTVTRSDDGTIVFTPAAGFIGQASFTYTIEDPDGAQSTATVYITIEAVPPTAVDDETTTPINTPVTIDVVGNDRSGDGSDLVLTNVGTFPNGTAVIVDNQLVVTPADGFVGVLEVPYTVCQADGECADAIAYVTVEADDPTEPPTDPTDPPTDPTEQPTDPTQQPTDPTPGPSESSTPPAGGGLPGTGVTPGLAVLGALVLLAAGAVLLIVRRRSTGTD